MLIKIGFNEALDLIEREIRPGPVVEASLLEAVDEVLAEDVRALVDSPSVDASLKDGYAVLSGDVSAATPENPVYLKLSGFLPAGGSSTGHLEPGTTIRVTTGAGLPPGAEAVLAGEFAQEADGIVRCWRDAEPGRNVLVRGADVRSGSVLARTGETLRPAMIGLLAAAGLDRVKIYKRPRLAVLSTGDEVVAPGQPLAFGQLYASNMVETAAWLKHFNFFEVITRVLPDERVQIAEAIRELMPQVDAFITSGGAWSSERDLMVDLFQDLGWRGIFHRVRLGPGKAAAFGLLEERPCFVLPGGPPSHEAAFLLLTLPGLVAMTGRVQGPFPTVKARLVKDLAGQKEWTQVLHARIMLQDGEFLAQPLKPASRLSGMAEKNALILLEEGVSEVAVGDKIDAILLHQPY